MRKVDLFETSFEHCAGIGAEPVACLVEDFEVGEREVGGFAVAAGDFVDDLNGFSVPAAAHEVFGGFVEGEEDEAAEEHDHCEQAHRDHEPAPAEVFGFGAHRVGFLTGVVAEERPGNKACEELGEGPEDREDRQEVLVRAGEKF